MNPENDFLHLYIRRIKMGYSTEFNGRFEIDKKLEPLHKLYLQALSISRRMKRNSDHPQLTEDPLRILVGLPVGVEGEFHVGSRMTDCPIWKAKNHHLFSPEFKKIALTLLCVQKYYHKNIGKDIFMTIISMLSGDFQLLDYSQEVNVKLISIQHPEFLISDKRAIVDHNRPASTQPGLWNQWIPSSDGKGIEWDGGKKFYDYVKWLEYIIKNFLIPWGYTLNGNVKFQGENSEDRGIITVANNIVKMEYHEISDKDESESEESEELEEEESEEEEILELPNSQHIN